MDNPETAGTSPHNSMDTHLSHSQTQRQALEPHLHTHQTRVPIEEHVPNRIATLELEIATLRAQLLDKDSIIDKFYSNPLFNGHVLSHIHYLSFREAGNI